jgi:hypothetical protein
MACTIKGYAPARKDPVFYFSVRYNGEGYSYKIATAVLHMNGDIEFEKDDRYNTGLNGPSSARSGAGDFWFC